MLLAYGIKNFFGFKNGAEVDFKLNSKVPDDVRQGRTFATVMGVKGGNGSGKTNLIKALGFLGDFCSSSFYSNKEYIEADSYFRCKEPSEFYVEFIVGDIFYKYELGVFPERIVYENIYRKYLKGNNRKTIKILERNYDKLEYRIDELSYIDIVMLKDKASIISTVFNYKLNDESSVFNDIHAFFSSIRTNVFYTGLRELSWSFDGLPTAAKFYNENNSAFEFAKKIISECDLGISDIQIRMRKDENNKDVYFPIFSHLAKDEAAWLTGYDESSGTKSLFVKLASYWKTLTFGGVLVMDEFDINYHPFMLPKLINLFESTESNPKNAQFIFTSHNTEIIDNLGKYRTYLVNKEDNESYCYRLDEIKGDILRHGRPISPIYRNGKIGGVPKI